MNYCEDRRAYAILDKLNAGKIILSQAVDEAREELDKEYDETLSNLLWNLGMEEHRMLERADKEKFLASLPEEERKRVIERGGCTIPCEVCDDGEDKPCYDP